MEERNEILEDMNVVFDFLSAAQPGADRADVVLAMGSQDLTVADTAAQAFWEKGAEWLVCSGGLGKDTAELFQEPEGVLYARRCLELGVPQERIIVEGRAANSGENFLLSRALLEGRRIFPRTGVIACKPYMARRAWATGTKQWPQVRWSVARPEISFSEYISRGNDMTAAAELMTGDLQRLRLYAGRFQAPVEVPDSVWAAGMRLAAAGYDRYIIREG